MKLSTAFEINCETSTIDRRTFTLWNLNQIVESITNAYSHRHKVASCIESVTTRKQGARKHTDHIVKVWNTHEPLKDLPTEMKHTTLIDCDMRACEFIGSIAIGVHLTRSVLLHDLFLVTSPLFLIDRYHTIRNKARLSTPLMER